MTLKHRFPGIPCLIVNCGALVGLADYVDRIGVDGVVFEYEFYEEDELQRLMNRGRQVFAFTVNQVADARRFQALGIHGIITDDPVQIRAALKSR